MELDLITGRTREELEKKLEGKKAEGWEVYGEGGIIDPKPESKFTDIPNFIYYWRHIVKTQKGEQPLISAEEFSHAVDGKRIKVKYGRCSGGGTRFGKPNKAQLYQQISNAIRREKQLQWRVRLLTPCR